MELLVNHATPLDSYIITVFFNYVQVEFTCLIFKSILP